MVDRSYKSFAFLFASLLISSFLVSFASAGPAEDIGNVINTVSAAVEPVASLLLGGSSTTSFDSGEILFSKVMFFAIVMSIIWLALSKVNAFSQNKTVLWVVSIAAAVLSTRWLSDASIVQAILLPYSALGVVISAGLPFFIWFAIVNLGMSDSPPFIRRMAWLFFTVVFFGLWILRYTELAGFGWMYVVVAVLGIIMAFIDGTIQRLKLKLKLETLQSKSAGDAIIALRRELVQISDDEVKRVITPSEARAREKDIKDRIASLSREL